MIKENYDFYSPCNLSLRDVDSALKDSLSVMYKLDEMTLKHSNNVSNLCTRVCEYMRCNNQFTIHCMIAGYIKGWSFKSRRIWDNENTHNTRIWILYEGY